MGFMSSTVLSATPMGTPETAPPTHIQLDDSLGAVFTDLIIAAIGALQLLHFGYELHKSKRRRQGYLELDSDYTSSNTDDIKVSLLVLSRNLSISPFQEISDFIIRLYYSRRIWIQTETEHHRDEQEPTVGLPCVYLPDLTSTSYLEYQCAIASYHTAIPYADPNRAVNGKCASKADKVQKDIRTGLEIAGSREVLGVGTSVRAASYAGHGMRLVRCLQQHSFSCLHLK
ncbi:hypothetical protein ACEPAF_4214 [Sanghuangporus sanghuang]